MVGFLKVFLRGIIITVLLPLILLVWVLYGIYCLIAFLIMLIKSMISFFAGNNATGEMKEDIEARRMLLEKEQAQEQATQMMSAMYQNAMAQMQNQAAFGMPQQPDQPMPMPAQPEPQQESNFGTQMFEERVEPEETETPVENKEVAEEENSNDNSY